MDFFVLIALNAQKNNYFKRFNLQNIYKLSQIKNIKIFTTNIYPQEIFVIEGMNKRKSIVFGREILSSLSEQEFSSLVVYCLSYVKHNKFSLRTFVSALNFIMFKMADGLGRPIFFIYDFYYSQLFNILQFFPLKIVGDKKAEKIVLSLHGNVALLKSAFSKIFRDQEKKLDYKEKIIFPLTCKSLTQEIIIEDIRLKVNEAFNY